MCNTQHSEITDNINKTTLVTFCSLLSISKPIDCFSQLLTVLALGIAIISSWWTDTVLLTILCCAVFVSGLMAKYYALRLYLDKKLFDYLVNHLDQLPKTLVELDEALIKLKLIKNTLTLRTLNERQYGTVKLLKKQIIALAIQLLLLIISVFIGIFYIK